MGARAVIFGCAGPTLAPAERAFFRASEPWGFILFARNVETPAQLRRLTADLRESVGRDAPVLIDQEGGRVARLRAPLWRDWAPALDECARLPDLVRRTRAMYLRNRLIAGELRGGGDRRQLRAGPRCRPPRDAPGAAQPLLRRRPAGGGDDRPRRWPMACSRAGCCR